MSFGYSVTDLVSLTTLSWKLYKSCKSAPSSFASLSSEVLSLHAVLKEAEEILFPEGQSHDGCATGKSAAESSSLSPSAQENLRVVADGCNGVLVDLQSLIDRYESLGRKKSNTWGRVKWGAEDIAELRSRLSSNVAMLNTFVSISQFTVQQKLNRYLSVQKNGNRESSLHSEQTADSLSSNDKLTWRSIRRELADIGITVAAFDANREFILNWFAEAVESGDFQPREEVDTDSSSDGADPDDADSPEKSSFVTFNRGVTMERKAASPPPSPHSNFKTKLRASAAFQPHHDKKTDRWKPSFVTSPTTLVEGVSSKPCLLTSVKSRNISSVREILKMPPNHFTPESFNTALQTAISLGDHTILHLLLTSRPPTYPPLDNEIYINTLLAASFDGHVQILRFLLTNHPANKTSFQSFFPLALKAASIRGRTPIVTALLIHYYDHLLNGALSPSPAPTHHLIPALRAAATQGHTAIVRHLLARGADPNRDKRFFLGNPLQAASFKGHAEIVALLLKHNADPNARGYQFGSALQAAALQGHLEIVKLLVRGGADVGLEGGKYGTALKAARHKGHEAVVKVLVEGGGGD
ncbi:hypothetical protein AJ78_05601 [Emergomyces pasteurianus Ep9510]|uniref:Uncharacterized protein n=1 Tax=Emergomyces pasteurianus Ep9510 TaxID=1447872 RepID=A0A1J9Q1G1_9EURO|nr:hypothetical protein AJ78_05601 [Emergomyces pasteurianus Ep9510]